MSFLECINLSRGKPGTVPDASCRPVVHTYMQGSPSGCGCRKFKEVNTEHRKALLPCIVSVSICEVCHSSTAAIGLKKSLRMAPMELNTSIARFETHLTEERAVGKAWTTTAHSGCWWRCADAAVDPHSTRLTTAVGGNGVAGVPTWL